MSNKASHQVIFMPSGRRGRVEEGESLLDAAQQMGVEIESICGGKLKCGKCKIRIEDGEFQKHKITSSADHVTPPSKEEVELLKKMGEHDYRLSCHAFVQNDALVYVPEEARAHKQVIRKSANERVIEIDPAIRQVYVEVEKAELGKHHGDWGRLQDALKKEWNLDNLSIDLPALQNLQANIRKGKWAVTVTLWHKEVIDVQPGYKEGIFGLAVDVGSTTVAAYLCDLRSGKILASESTMNPQVIYGEDLMSRVSYATSNIDGLEKMHAAIIKTINQLAKKAARQVDLRARNIHEAVFVGNTTMTHILLGIDPVELGSAPFALANRDSYDLKARDLGLKFHPSANVHVLASQAGHVGADNVGALLAETPYEQKQVTLLVDIGTNAEIVLGNQDWMFSASSPTGPAFEGAQITFGMRAAPGAIERVRIDPETLVGKFSVIGEEKWSDDWQTDADASLDQQPAHLASGICGSGIIEAVAEMFLHNIILASGRFNPDLTHELIQWEDGKGAYVLASAQQSATGNPILVTQDDVRNIQLGKAALYAGAKLLMSHAEVQSVDRILLAGAFGSFIDTKYAMILGLIPNCDLDQVVAVGNAAGDGARIALLNKDKRVEAQRIAHWVKYIETAIDPKFQDEFVTAIHIPHAVDIFPQLKNILPEKSAPKSNKADPKIRRRKVQKT